MYVCVYIYIYTHVITIITLIIMMIIIYISIIVLVIICLLVSLSLRSLAWSVLNAHHLLVYVLLLAFHDLFSSVRHLSSLAVSSPLCACLVRRSLSYSRSVTACCHFASGHALSFPAS